MNISDSKTLSPVFDAMVYNRDYSLIRPSKGALVLSDQNGNVSFRGSGITGTGSYIVAKEGYYPVLCAVGMYGFKAIKLIPLPENWEINTKQYLQASNLVDNEDMSIEVS